MTLALHLADRKKKKKKEVKMWRRDDINSLHLQLTFSRDVGGKMASVVLKICVPLI